MGKIFGREPVLFLGAVSAILNLLIGFGLNLSAEQLALINAATAAVISFIARSQVSPVDEP